MVSDGGPDESGDMDNAAPPPTSAGPELTGSHESYDSSGPRVSTAEMRDLSRLRRSVTDRHIAGVAGGLARHLDVDPILVRVAFVVGAFFGGAGLLLYFAAWLFVPEEGTQDQPLGLDERSRVGVLILAAVLALLAAMGDWAGAYWFPWPIVLIALGVVWFVRRDRKTHTWQPYAGPVPTEQAPATDVTAGTGAPMPPVDYTRPRVPHRRKRGPVLIWFTLALIALAVGVLGVVDLAGADVAASAYSALALAITAGMLLLGAFWGRAGGLILVGLLVTGSLLASVAVENIETDRVTYAPTRAALVKDVYEVPAGELVVDLSGVRDLEALDGRDLAVNVGAGRVEVIVPPDLSINWTTEILAGRVDAFDHVAEGIDSGVGGGEHRGADSSEVDLVVSMVAGEIVIRESEAVR
jgi:phage shock protein PspC (stress-responsive transcriptional regulator)